MKDYQNVIRTIKECIVSDIALFIKKNAVNCSYIDTRNYKGLHNLELLISVYGSDRFDISSLDEETITMHSRSQNAIKDFRLLDLSLESLALVLKGLQKGMSNIDIEFEFINENETRARLLTSQGREVYLNRAYDFERCEVFVEVYLDKACCIHYVGDINVKGLSAALKEELNDEVNELFFNLSKTCRDY